MLGFFRGYLAERGIVRGIQGAWLGSSLFVGILLLVQLVLTSKTPGSESPLIPILMVVCFFNIAALLVSVLPAILGGILLGRWLYQDILRDTLSLKNILRKSILTGSAFGLGACLVVMWIFSLVKVHNETLISSPQSFYTFLSYVPVVIACAACSGVWTGIQLVKDLKFGLLYHYLPIPGNRPMTGNQ